MKSKIWVLVIAAQIAIVVILLGYIYHKSVGILRSFNITPLEKEGFVTSPSGSLRFFYEPKPNTIGESNLPWIPKKSKHTINSDSLNERYDYTTKKNDSTYRIIALGDSFTQGVYVNTQDNYSEVLEDVLNTRLECKNIKKFEVINLGVAGYDIEYQVKRFELRGKKYDPDLLVWLINSSDFYDINEITLPLLTNHRQKLLSNSQDSLEEVWKKSWNMARNDFNKQISQSGSEEIFLEKLLEINKFYNGKVVIISSSLRKEGEVTLERFIKLNKERVFHLKIENLSRDAYIPNDAHPNEKGHSLIALELFNSLIKNNIISCI